MKAHLSLLLAICSYSVQAQIVYETTAGSPYSTFKPRTLAVSNSGSVYVAGGFDKTVQYYKTVDGHTVRADSTLPSYNAMFLMKMDAGGKMVKRAFFPVVYSLARKDVYAEVIEGNDMVLTRKGELLITGFVTRYRKENYKGDRTQGVYAALIDTNLTLVWDTLIPSYYNSVGEKVIETADGDFVIVASTFLRSDSVAKYLDNSVTATRLLKISGKGSPLMDTLLPTLPRDVDYEFLAAHPNAKAFFYNNFHDSDLNHLLPPFDVEDVKEIPGGYMFSGVVLKREYSGWEQPYKALLFETDKNFAVKKVRAYSMPRDKTYSDLKFFGGRFVWSDDHVVVTGISQIATPPDFIVIIDRNTYDTIKTFKIDGQVFEYPGIVQAGKNKYAICANVDYKYLQLTLLDGRSIAKTMELKKYVVNGFADIKEKDGYVYVLGTYKPDKELREVYLAKVKIP